MVNAASGEYEEFSGEDWSNTKAAAVIGDTAYIATTSTIWTQDLTDSKAAPKEQSDEDWSALRLLTASNKLYAVTEHTLYEIEPKSGESKELGSDSWTNTHHMTVLNKRLYLLTGSTLYYINLDGVDEYRTHELSDEDWSNARIMVAHDGYLYIATSTLYKINVQDGTYQELGSDDWSNTIAATVVNGKLYLITSSIYSVNLDGSDEYATVTVSDDDWSNTKALAAW